MKKINITKIFKLNLFLKSFLHRYLLKDIRTLFLCTVRSKKNIYLGCTKNFLPVKLKKFSVVRSPTTSKLSKEQFEIRFYKVNIVWYFNTFLKYLFFKNLISHFNFKFSYSDLFDLQLAIRNEN